MKRLKSVIGGQLSGFLRLALRRFATGRSHLDEFTPHLIGVDQGIPSCQTRRDTDRRFDAAAISKTAVH
jgi:hypothetical protein